MERTPIGGTHIILLFSRTELRVSAFHSLIFSPTLLLSLHLPFVQCICFNYAIIVNHIGSRLHVDVSVSFVSNL